MESGYAARIAFALFRLQIGFKKPLRYKREDNTHPEFILTDTSSEVKMEVFGMATPEYLMRNQKKNASYTKDGSRPPVAVGRGQRSDAAGFFTP